MSAVRQYYCYQCMNQTQVDVTHFTCRRCGGGFVQEMPDDPTPPPRDYFGQPSALTIPPAPGAPGVPSPSPSIATNMPTAFNSRQFVRPQMPPDPFAPYISYTQIPQQQHQRMPMLTPHGSEGEAVFGYPRGPLNIAQGTRHPHGHAVPVIHGQITLTQHIPLDQSNATAIPPNTNTQPFAVLNGANLQQVGPHQQQNEQFPGQFAIPASPQPQPYNFWQPQQRVMRMATMQQQHQNGPPMEGSAGVSQGSPGTQQQQDGVILVQVGEEGGLHHIQNMFHFGGANLDLPGVMQQLTENMDEILTTILNQFGTQGGPPPITQEDVDRIPVQTVTKEMLAENKSCSICLENFNALEQFKELSCTHRFHTSCIDRWLLMHGNCPICRAHFGPAADNEENNQGGNQPNHIHVQWQLAPQMGLNFPPRPFQQPPMPAGRYEMPRTGPMPPRGQQPQPHSALFHPAIHPHQNQFNQNQQMGSRSVLFSPRSMPAPVPAPLAPHGQAAGYDTFVINGQMFMQDANGPRVILQPLYHHHHNLARPIQYPHTPQRQPAPQMQMRAPNTGLSESPSRPRNGGSRPTIHMQMPQIPRAPAQVQVPTVAVVRPASGNGPNFIQSIISSVAQALSNTAAPATSAVTLPSNSVATSSNTDTGSVRPASAPAATTSTNTNNGSAQRTPTTSSLNEDGPPTTQTAHLRDDMDFD